MLKDIVSVQPLNGYQLHLRFEDGIEGTINLAQIIRFEGVFAPLAEHDYFLQVRVNPELGTICWPNDADLDQDVLYSIITGEPLPVPDLETRSA